MATASCPAPVKQMETLLECSVCMETLTQPRTLSCYHSFCKHCLENYVAIHREKAVKAKASVPEIFECPLCRTEFSVKEGENIGEKMPANHFINNLLELLSIQQQAHHVECQSCKANAPAASRCISCEKYLCHKCLDVHNNWPDFEDHVLLTLEELSKPENRAKAKAKPRCEKHDKVLKFYCETCEVLVCRYCMDLNHTRPEHTWFPLTDVVVQHKEALKASSGIFEKQKNDAAESNRKIEEAMETLKKNATKARDAIKQQQQNILNAFTKKLEKETTALLDQVDMKYREVSKPLLKQQTNVKAYFEKAKSSLDFTSNILSSGSDEVLLSLKHEIEEKAGSIENERPEFMEPVHDGLFEYHPKPTKDIMENLKLNHLGKIDPREYEYKRSESSFLFSLKNKANMSPFKCQMKDGRNDEAIYCEYKFGPVFGRTGNGFGHDLAICPNANTTQGSKSNLGDTYQPPPGYEPGAPETKALLAGSYGFTPSEIEVFCTRIILIDFT
ncbi:E3 ubiquitin-protein ligase TRIM33-like [Dendronephthya gigantea]|uniref:E3 ubiquitin-protein ligase TRIM33-like n=1 Tax=Dendronephthya gigantea TaxID=151771 RepID=UPI00106B18F1|nr:E3 ubiquitin-protein ligase TRIM33-like [Dendronephthya gigantea]